MSGLRSLALLMRLYVVSVDGRAYCASSTDVSDVITRRPLLRTSRAYLGAPSWFWNGATTAHLEEARASDRVSRSLLTLRVETY